MKTPKAVPVVLRCASEGTEILVFEHPQAGVQLVKGTVERGESVAQAAIRELEEESGITGAVCERDLGTWELCPRGQVWHFREMRVPANLRDSWEHYTTDGGGHVFKFHWHPIAAEAPSTWHPVYIAALGFVREGMARLAEQRARGEASGAA